MPTSDPAAAGDGPVILAIETSCDETAASVVDGGAVRSNVLRSQITEHRPTGGIVPEVAARLQLEAIGAVIDQALSEAGTDWSQIDRIAVTAGPGLIGSLMVGLETAKALAYAHGKPLVPVNHLAGHLYACLAGVTEFEFPYLGLVVSGGHTELVMMRGHHDFELIGETRDDAAGEAFDKVARLLGLPYPGGPEISRLAADGDPTAFAFPRAMLDQDNYDFSFSGLKSAVRREVSGGAETPTLDADRDPRRAADLAASFQTAVVDALVTKTVAAAEEFGPRAVLLGGGVAANGELRQELADRLKAIGIPLRVTPFEFATDNAAMIGLAATYVPTEPLTPTDAATLTADPGAALAGD